MKYLTSLLLVAFATLAIGATAYNKVQIVDGSGNPTAYEKVMIVSESGSNVQILESGSIVLQGGTASSLTVVSAPPTGMQLWLKADAITNVSEAGAVNTWPDSSGNGRNATTTTGTANGPYYYGTSGPNGKPALLFGTGTMSTSGTFFNPLSTAASVYAVYTAPTNNNYSAFSWSVSQDIYGVWFGQGKVTRYFPFAYSAPLNVGEGTEVRYSSPDYSVDGMIYDGSRIYRRKNGFVYNSPATTGTTGWNGPVVLGRGQNGTYNFSGGYISEILIYDRALTSSEITQIENYLGEKYGINKKRPIVFRGDSLTYGTGAITTTYPRRVYDLLGNVGALDMDGHASEQLNNAVQVDPARYNNSFFKMPRILCLSMGTNDLNAKVSGSTVYTRLVTRCKTAKATGDSVIVGTVTPCAVLSGTALTAMEAERQVYNELIRTTWNTFADGLADVGNDPTIGVFGAQDNTTYYQADKTHLTDAGYTIIGNIWADALKSVLNRWSGPVSFSGTSAAPSNSGTAAFWATVVISGTQYRIPVYQ